MIVYNYLKNLKKKEVEEMQRRIEEYKEKERQRSGKKIDDLAKFSFVDEDKSGSHEALGDLFYEGINSEHKSIPIDAWEKEVGIPTRRKDGRPTPKKDLIFSKKRKDRWFRLCNG